MSKENLAKLVLAASTDIEVAIKELLQQYPNYQVCEIESDRASARYLLKSKMTFVEYYWHVRDKHNIAIGPLDEFGKIIERGRTPYEMQFQPDHLWKFRQC